MKDDELKRGAEFIVCRVCGNKSTRQGAQDYCDIYTCDKGHLTKYKIDAPRKVWAVNEH